MTVRLLRGDCRDVLPRLPDASVNCIVTSPPYYGLRDYGTARWEGGDPTCGHRQVLGGNGSASAKQVSSFGTQGYQFRCECNICGARRIDQQIGLEQTPDAYVAELVAVFCEARRVLRDDGTVWLNLGDSYNYRPPQRRVTDYIGPKQRTNRGASGVPSRSVVGLKPKDILGIPWRVAFALQADGWFLRQDIIWSKPNPMPESVQDRCTKAHEYVFLLSKSARYWFDAKAIAEPAVQDEFRPTFRGGAYVGSSAFDNSGNGGLSADTGNVRKPNAMRNRRSVWTIAAQPYKGAHFATMPPDLAELCIKAGCPKGGVVLDPFAGSGTTGLVADRLGRNAVLIDLNPEYGGQSRARIEADAGMFAQVVDAAE